MARSAPHPTKNASSDSGSFYPPEDGLPTLPAIDWSAIGATAPTVLPASGDALPEADVVVITWAEAEWAALQHVFVSSGEAMSHGQSKDDHEWTQWTRYDKDMPPYSGHDAESWTYWGLYCLVQMGSKKVLLFKSNTHLDWPGGTYLSAMIEQIIKEASPSMLFSIGTAGGSRLTDHLGAVNVVNAGTLYSDSEPTSDWPTYASDYTPDWTTISTSGFDSLLVDIPATEDRLQALADAFNAHYGTDIPLSGTDPATPSFDPLGLCAPTSPVALNDLVTPTNVPLLTTATFVVGTTDGQYADYAVIEMDDAVIGKVCQEKGVAFGFVRNVSDPAQNAVLPSEVQGNWGSAVYETFGLYTSVNGALTTWALIDAMASSDA